MPNQHLSKDDPLKGKKSGKWTKYGGAIYGLVKEEIVDTWNCQTCGSESPKELPPFLHEFYPGEFIRICNICKAKIDKISEIENNSFIQVKTVIKISRTKRD